MVVRLVHRFNLFGIRVLYEVRSEDYYGEPYRYHTSSHRVWVLSEVRDTHSKQFNDSQAEILEYLALNTTQYSSAEEYFRLVN